MKKNIRTAVVLLTLCIGLVLAAGKAFDNPEDAAMDCQTMQQLLQEGYRVQTCVPVAIPYKVTPTGPYDWGYVDTRLEGFPPGAYETQVVYVRCYIKARKGKYTSKFWETHNSVTIAL